MSNHVMRQTAGFAGRLSLCGVAAFCAMLAASIPAATFISFQQGDLRTGANGGAGTDGTLVSGSYNVGATVLRSDQPGTAQDGSQLLVGNNSGATNRTLLSFDVSYLTNAVGTNFTRIDSAALMLTHDTNSGAGSSSVQAVYLTSHFTEATATWNQPHGPGSTVGGEIGVTLRERGAIGVLVAPDQEVWDGPKGFWDTNNTQGPDLLVDAVRDALTNGSGTIYLLVKRKTELTNNFYSRYVHDSDARADFGPELLVGVDSVPDPTPVNEADFSITAFADEFNGPSLDASVWALATLDGYRTNVSVTNGLLWLTTRAEGDGWREGFVETRHFAAKYGYYKARLKLAEPTGMNNAFWLNTPFGINGAENVIDRTEVDITEAHAAHLDSHMTVHDWAPAHFSPFAKTVNVFNMTADFHDVALEWKADNSLVFYWDGLPKAACAASNFLSLDSMIPLAVLFSTKVIDWAGPPGANLDGSAMLVDYVRVLQKPGWTGALNGNWGSTTNWGPDGVPGTGEAAIFNQPSLNTTISLATNKSCHSLYFDNAGAPAFTFAAGPYKLHLGSASGGIGGITVGTTVTNSQSINLDLVAERSLQFGNFSRTPSATLNLNGAIDAATSGTEIQLCGNAPVQIAGALSANVGRVLKWGTNTARLSGANAHTGGTEVREGALVVASPLALGASGANADTLVTDGATLLIAAGVDYLAPEPLKLHGSGAPGRLGVLDLEGTGAASFAGPISLETNVTIACASAGSVLTLSGPVNGSATIAKAGDGAVRLVGDNSFSGLVTVAAGALIAGHNHALGTTGAATLVKNTGVLRLEGNIVCGEPLRLEGAAPGYVHLANASNTNALTGGVSLLGGGLDYGISVDAGQLTLAGDVAFTDSFGTTRTIRLDGAGHGMISGAVRDGSNAAVAINKIGAGRWTLNGTNLNTGAATVGAGELILNGTSRSPVTVSGGTLGGSGTISNHVTITTGIHTPGASIGMQTIYGDYTVAAGGKLRVEINGATPGAQHDRISVLGGTANTVALTGALEVVARPGLATNTVFTIIENDGADAVSGTFAGMPNNTTFFADGYTWRINYDGGTGNDVTLTLLAACKPALQLNRDTETIQILWPDWAAEYALWSTSNLAPPVVWQPVTNAASLVNTSMVAILPLGLGSRFFQLRWP